MPSDVSPRASKVTCRRFGTATKVREESLAYFRRMKRRRRRLFLFFLGVDVSRTTTMSRATLPPDTAAAVRGVLSTPLQTVLSALQDLPPPKHRCAPSAGPGGARFVGGAGHKPQRVVTLNHNCTVADALEMLARHRILSAPVIIQPDPLRADDIHHERLESDDARVEPPTLLGFFDIGDALRCVVEELPEEDRVSHAPDHPRRNVLSWMRVMDGVERRVANKRLVSVLGDDAELMYRADVGAHTLGETLREGFLDGRSANGAVHRIAIFDADGEITRVVSMSDAVRYLASRADHLGGLAEMNLRRLVLVGRASGIEGGLVVVPPTTPAIEAFALMREKRVSGVGVLDDREGLIANLSASDLRCIQPEHFGILGLPAAEFLALLHGTSYAGFSRSRSAGADNPFFAKMNEGGFRRAGPFLVIAAPDDPLGKVLSLIVEHGVHRVYVCEERDGKPLDVVTLTDVLRLACNAGEQDDKEP